MICFVCLCFQVKCVGENCTFSSECRGDNFECSGSPSTCRCPLDQFFDVETGNCLQSKLIDWLGLTTFSTFINHIRTASLRNKVSLGFLWPVLHTIIYFQSNCLLFHKAIMHDSWHYNIHCRGDFGLQLCSQCGLFGHKCGMYIVRLWM